MDRAWLGNFHIMPAGDYFDREDDYASSGLRGLADFVKALLKCIEAQARGFAHGHGKIHSVPDGIQGLLGSLESVVREIEALEAVSDGTPLAGEAVEAVVSAATNSYNERLLASASTRQYESATLPARQLGQEGRDAPFSEKQQRQSRYDGGMEDDETTLRPLVPIVPAEPAAHTAREQRRADYAHQAPRDAYRAVSYTHLTLPTKRIV